MRVSLITTLAATAFAASALTGGAPVVSASAAESPQVTLAAVTVYTSPAGIRCLVGHNPDGSCRGHRQAAGAKRCVKSGAKGYQYGKDLGEKIGAATGGFAGGVATHSVEGGYEVGKAVSKLNGQIGGAYGAALYCGLNAGG